jgi:hypothetical protein
MVRFYRLNSVCNCLDGPEIVKNLYSTFINILEYYSTFTFHKTFGNTGSGKLTTIKLIIT